MSRIKVQVQFLIKYFGKALAYFSILIVLFVLFNNYVIEPNKTEWKVYMYSHTPLVYISYIFSEVFFGILPPELYMKWALHKHDGVGYWLDVLFFTSISYAAGVLSFYIGKYLHKILIFRYMSRKSFAKLWPLFRKYGSALIIAAAMTPLPWALVSMLVGSTQYRIKKYLLFAIFRILRFTLYGYAIYTSL